MSLNSSFWTRKSRQLGQAELEGATEFIPQAVLVMDSYLRVVAVNNAACELFSRPRVMLDGKFLPELIKLPEDFPQRLSSDQSPPDLILAELNLPGNACQDVNLRLTGLSPGSEYLLVTLELAPLHQTSQASPETHAQFWQGMFLLASATEQAGIDQCLRTALDGARSLIPCQVAALYLCKSGETNPSEKDPPTIPLANRSAARWGDDDTLPAFVPPQDLVLLRTIRVWDSSKRPPTSLHRAAREAGFTYLAVAPLGLPQKLSGLIVLGDKEKDPPAELLRLIQLIAVVMARILDDQDRRLHLDRTIDSQSIQLRVMDVAMGVVQDGIFVLSPDMKLRRINQAAETIFGYKNREIEGQPVDQILLGSEQILPALHLAQSGAPTYHLNNINLLRRYGDRFKALVRVQPIFHEGTVESILVIVRDLSELAAYEAHARQLAQHAELGEVMSAFAHEVRNPIHSISSGLQFMDRSLAQDDPTRETVGMMLMDVDRVNELMKSMLSTTRTTDIKPRPIDLGKVVTSLVERLKPTITREGISCQINVSPGLPQVNGDIRALEQIFNNLINNAIQAMKGRPQSQLIVKVQSQKAAKDRLLLEVSIADNGPGIPKENLDKIFQP
ncbi:MAG TPA: PAS domain S-box protein, partial [Anaerolineales bacterium]|nr:PAS domain S-box protein [Anaerolineales bacterium]